MIISELMWQSVQVLPECHLWSGGCKKLGDLENALQGVYTALVHRCPDWCSWERLGLIVPGPSVSVFSAGQRKMICVEVGRIRSDAWLVWDFGALTADEVVQNWHWKTTCGASNLYNGWFSRNLTIWQVSQEAAQGSQYQSFCWRPQVRSSVSISRFRLERVWSWQGSDCNGDWRGGGLKVLKGLTVLMNDVHLPSRSNEWMIHFSSPRLPDMISRFTWNEISVVVQFRSVFTRNRVSAVSLWWDERGRWSGEKHWFYFNVSFWLFSLQKTQRFEMQRSIKARPIAVCTFPVFRNSTKERPRIGDSLQVGMGLNTHEAKWIIVPSDFIENLDVDWQAVLGLVVERYHSGPKNWFQNCNHRIYNETTSQVAGLQIAGAFFRLTDHWYFSKKFDRLFKKVKVDLPCQCEHLCADNMCFCWIICSNPGLTRKQKGWVMSKLPVAQFYFSSSCGNQTNVDISSYIYQLADQMMATWFKGKTTKEECLFLLAPGGMQSRQLRRKHALGLSRPIASCDRQLSF